MLISLTACDRGHSALYGDYSTINTGRQATLKLERTGSYEFCYQVCSHGPFVILGYEPNAVMIKLTGYPIERYVRQVVADSAGARSGEEDSVLGHVELGYDVGLVFPPAIYIDAGNEILFVKD